MRKEIYLDHHTISKPSQAVIERLHRFLLQKWGTPFAPHQKGQELYGEIDASLQELYTALGVTERSFFVLTAGGAEAMFQLLMNFYIDEIRETGRNHLLTTTIDEAPLLLPMSRLEQLGTVTRFLPVDKQGVINLSVLQQELKPKTSLLSLSWVNAITGVIQPVSEIVRICHAKGVKVHVNASGVIGHLPISFEELGVDFLTFDGDKIRTPQGIGGLLQRTKPHESSHNVASLSALSLAVSEKIQKLEQTTIETARLRDAFEAELKMMLPDTVILFQDSDRLSHISAVAFPDVMAESLLYILNRHQIFATLGGGQFQKLSTQLKNCGISEELAQSAVSFAISEETTEEDLAMALDILVPTVRKLANLSAGL